MNVSLTAELEKFVCAKVSTGRSNSASEVVREAVRLLEENNRQAGQITFSTSTIARKSAQRCSQKSRRKPDSDLKTSRPVLVMNS